MTPLSAGFYIKLSGKCPWKRFLHSSVGGRTEGRGVAVLVEHRERRKKSNVSRIREFKGGTEMCYANVKSETEQGGGWEGNKELRGGTTP